MFVAVVFVAFNAWLSPLGLTRERIQHEFVAMSDFANSLRLLSRNFLIRSGVELLMSELFVT